MGDRLKRYKKAVVAALGVAAGLAVTLSPLFPANSTVGAICQIVVGVATVAGVAVVRNAPLYSNTPTVRSGPPPIR